jgi:hypothetical protein
MFKNKETIECNNMKKRKIGSTTMVIFIALLFFISISLSSVIADPGNNKGNGNGNMDPPYPPEDLDNNGTGIHDGSGEQNKEENSINEDDGQIIEQNQERKQNHKGDYDNDNVGDKQERYQHRKMEMVFEQNRTRIRSEWQQDEYEDEFEIIFDIEQGPRLKLDYENNIHSSENELSFEIQIKELIEYRDTNRNDRYDEDDVIVNAYSFENSNFNNFTYQNQLSDDGEKIKYISTQTEDDIFKMNLYFSGNFSRVNNQIVSPTEIKIDFIINNYPFEEESTQLALRTMLETEHETELDIESFDEIQGFSENESVLNITTINNIGFYSWAETVVVDNITKPVNYTIQSQIMETISNDEKISNKIINIYFSYPRGSNIVHDPKLGVVSISFETFAMQSIVNLINVDNIVSYVGICILASFLFLGVVIIRKRI